MGLVLLILPQSAALWQAKRWQVHRWTIKLPLLSLALLCPDLYLSLPGSSSINLARMQSKGSAGHCYGPIAMIIGLTLAGNALSDATSSIVNAETGAVAAGDPQLVANMTLLVALITLISTILFSVYLKGVLGQLPLLLGPIVGCIAAFIISLTTDVNLFKQVPSDVANAGVFALPHITLPKPSWMAVAAIMPVALATIPESTAHVYQLDIYINDLAKKKGVQKRYDIENKLGLNLIGDGVGDMIAGAIGGPGGTNYGENISAMAITRVFSIPVLIGAAIYRHDYFLLYTFGGSHLFHSQWRSSAAWKFILFGAIAAQGVAIMIDKQGGHV